MKEYKVKLNSINDVKELVSASSMQSCDIDVVSGRYLVDAKSIMGLFSLDLANPVTLQVHGTDAQCEEFYKLIESIIVK